jgi:hypothetical protein
MKIHFLDGNDTLIKLKSLKKSINWQNVPGDTDIFLKLFVIIFDIIQNLSKNFNKT